MAVNLLNGVWMWLCDCVAVGPAVVGHYDISDTHSEQEQQSHSLSGSFPPLLNLQDGSLTVLLYTSAASQFAYQY